MNNSTIKHKQGNCKWEGCDYHGPLIAGYCQQHYWQHRHQIKHSNKKSTIKQSNKNSGQKELFDQIWKQREHKSWLTGKSLDKFEGTDFYPNLFAHLLSKLNYKKWKLKPDNIILLTPEEHRLLDQGTEEQRQEYKYKVEKQGYKCDWEKLYELIEEYKQNYI